MKFTITTLVIIIASALMILAISTEKVDVDASAKIRESLSKAKQVFIHEGLPHHTFEAELLKSEKKNKDTLSIAGFPFYSAKIAAKDEAAAALKRVASNSESYVAFSGEKRCGGFHPDYALTWSDGSTEYSILFCYGCGEALVVEGKNTFRYDFKKFSDLKSLLAPFKSERPSKPKG